MCPIGYDQLMICLGVNRSWSRCNHGNQLGMRPIANAGNCPCVQLAISWLHQHLDTWLTGHGANWGRIQLDLLSGVDAFS